jgi:hypothetical protein
MTLAFARTLTCYRLAAATLLALLVVTFATPSVAAALEPGTSATVRTDDGTCLRMRSEAGLQGAILACIPDRSTVAVLLGMEAVDGFQWQRIQYGGQSGWSVEQYLVATLTPAPSEPAPSAATALAAPALSGSLPAAGGFGLAVWSGGPIDRIPPIAASMGCTLRAVWVTRSGEFVGYVYGAPNVVNEPWNGAFPDGSLSANSPIIAVCATAGTSAPPSPPPPPSQGPGPGPIGTPGVPPGFPQSPPGPAGNG